MHPAEHYVQYLCKVCMMEKNIFNSVFQCCASTVPYETTIYKIMEKFQKPDSVVERRKYKTVMI